MKLLVVDNYILYIFVSVQVQEKGVAWIFWDCCIHLARLARRAGISQLEDACKIGIYSKP